VTSTPFDPLPLRAILREPDSYTRSFPQTVGLRLNQAVGSAGQILQDALVADRTQPSHAVAVVDSAQAGAAVRQSVTAAAGPPPTIRITSSSLPELLELADSICVDLLGGEFAVRGSELFLARHDSSVFDHPNQHRLTGLVDAGVDVLMAPGRFPCTVVIGADLALLSADSRAGRGRVVLVRIAEVVRELSLIQDGLREIAIRFADFIRLAATFVPDGQHRQVLAKMCAGRKDETAAREMNMSVRTYRRYVARIMQDLNVNSRFEAGLRVAELGLSSLPTAKAYR
jgi:DNA-binding CsgD family transcriptional regulator